MCVFSKCCSGVFNNVMIQLCLKLDPERKVSHTFFSPFPGVSVCISAPLLPSHCSQLWLCWITDTGSQQGCVWFQFNQAYLCQHFFDCGHHSPPQSKSQTQLLYSGPHAWLVCLEESDSLTQRRHCCVTYRKRDLTNLWIKLGSICWKEDFFCFIAKQSLFIGTAVQTSLPWLYSACI